MKMAKADRDSVINRSDSICISMCKRDRDIIDKKAAECGLSRSSYVRMIIKKYILEN
jgi:predicted DNA binding CopG/RHH family protein